MTDAGDGAGNAQADNGANDDIKAKMREALERKQAHDHPDDSTGHRAKAHGPEVSGGAPVPKMHRRKAGGGGS